MNPEIEKIKELLKSEEFVETAFELMNSLGLSENSKEDIIFDVVKEILSVEYKLLYELDSGYFMKLVGRLSRDLMNEIISILNECQHRHKLKPSIYDHLIIFTGILISKLDFDKICIDHAKKIMNI